MTAMTSAGTVLGISAGIPATFDDDGFEALTFATIGEITDISGELGRSYTAVTHNPLATRGTGKLKGSYNSGSATVTLAIDDYDAGQLLAEAALSADQAYSFRLTLQDGAITYFRALVMSFPANVASVDSITSATVTLEITADDDGNDFVDGGETPPPGFHYLLSPITGARLLSPVTGALLLGAN